MSRTRVAESLPATRRSAITSGVSRAEVPGGVGTHGERRRAVTAAREGSRANPENAEAGSSAARRGRHWRERGAVYLARYTPRKEYTASRRRVLAALEMPSVPAEPRAVGSISPRRRRPESRGFRTGNTYARARARDNMALSSFESTAVLGIAATGAAPGRRACT